MTDDIININRIRQLASAQGLVLRGGFQLETGDDIPDHASGRVHLSILLFGQAGSSIWKSFVESPEYGDGEPDPMDRWSGRTGSLLAKQLGGTALFPFDGPPWFPFGQWAQRAENICPSPLGILLHPQYGLWHAYRFAIAMPVCLDSLEEIEQPLIHEISAASHACISCKGRPCLTACPVNAFAEGTYDVSACASYLQDNEQSDCHRLGCRARDACPEGGNFRYEPAHLQFHMQQFHASLK